MGTKFRFSKKLIDALPACPAESRSRDAEYSDTDVPGLRLLVSKTGRKAFLFRYTSPSGRKRSMGLGRYPEFDIQEARERALEARRLLAHGEDPQEVREIEVKRKTCMTFRQFVKEDYLPHSKTLRSHATIETRLRLHVLPELGDRPLNTITVQEIQRLHDKMLAKSCAGTANRILASIKRVFNLAILWGKMDGPSPALRVKLHPENNLRQVYLEGDSLKRFMAALDADPNPMIADYFRLLLSTGVRRNEALVAKFSDVHLESGRWFLPKTKTGSRTVHLNEVALEVLRRREQARVPGNPYVFPSLKVKGGHFNGPQKAFRRILKRAHLKAGGADGLCIHSLRHSHASLALAAGASLYVVQNLLGHRHSTTTTRYAHLADGQLKASSAQVADLLTQASR